MRRISSKTVNICWIYSSLEEEFEFCWSSLADEHKHLPKSTRRHIKLYKFVFGTPWLPDLFCKHWFASSVWNFCHWVADVPPRETSPAAKSEEKRMFSQAIGELGPGKKENWESTLVYCNSCTFINSLIIKAHNLHWQRKHSLFMVYLMFDRNVQDSISKP